MAAVVAPHAADALKKLIQAESEKLGFCICGFTDCAPLADHPSYVERVRGGHLGTMTFLARADHIEKRLTPARVMESAKTVCVLGVPYNLMGRDAGIASYAYYEDYHDQIQRLAAELMTRVSSCIGRELVYKVCVDSAPIMERSLAVRAGLGWIGKSSMFIHPKFGSALFLCEILLEEELPPDAPFTAEYCGQCQRCVEACPNHCINPQTRTILPDRCASYLTIEHKGLFEGEQSQLASVALFGCDRCLWACPWNQRRGDVPTPLIRQDAIPDLRDLGMTDEDFKARYKGSSFFRTKNKGLQRNLRNWLSGGKETGEDADG